MDAPWTPRINAKRHTNRHIIVKKLKVTDREKILKKATEKQFVTSKGAQWKPEDSGKTYHIKNTVNHESYIQQSYL